MINRLIIILSGKVADIIYFKEKNFPTGFAIFPLNDDNK